MESSGSTSEAVTSQCGPGESMSTENIIQKEADEQSRRAWGRCWARSVVTFHGRSGETGICNRVKVRRGKRSQGWETDR